MRVMNNIIESILETLFANYKHLAADKDLFRANLYKKQDSMISTACRFKNKEEIINFWDNYAKNSLLK